MRTFCLCWILGISAIADALHDISLDGKAEPDIHTRMEKLDAELPPSYRCCPDGSRMNLSEGFYADIECIDGKGNASVISLECDYTHILSVYIWRSWHIQFYVERGVLWVGDGENIRSTLESTQICFGKWLAVSQSGNDGELHAVYCLDEQLSEGEYQFKLDENTSSVLCLVSLPFLALTILVYAAFPVLRDLQGLSIICLCGSLMVAFALEAWKLNAYGSDFCQAGGYLMYYSFISSFLWMSALAHQGFVSVRNQKDAVPRDRQFARYCYVAWGVPGALLVFVMISDVTPGGHILPGMGMNFECWFNGKAAKWAYFLAPLTIIMAANILMYACSAYHIWRQSTSSNSRTLRYKFWMSLRLFVVVGVSWLNETFKMAHGKGHIIWVIGDIWNLLQGVLIFVVLVVLRGRALQAIVSSGHAYCLGSWMKRWMGDDDRETDEVLQTNATGAGDRVSNMDTNEFIPSIPVYP